MNVTDTTTVGQIVAADFRAAAAFQAAGIDFCCGGRRTLGDACRDRGLAVEEILKAIQRSCAEAEPAPRFTEWEADAIAGFIVGTHHAYVRRALPILTGYTAKLARVHGGRHPELGEVAQLMEQVADEMSAHMAKEEQVLFPYIAAVAEASRLGRALPRAHFGAIENPIRMMEQEHESAGAGVARIRELTNGYTVPDDGCTTYRACFEELATFERDLHAHVHLENNVLFPKARTLVAPALA
jgi:regulator of cell morphogenesis and NO signaling